ncbi:MAG: hypothetical protein MRK01_07395 [Candidatus Scalindua sp.]|nr:hypothetical protein [Candidatus Scalindua sp.]
MDIETAIKIVKEYGRILKEDPVRNIQGRFLSQLPYDKETIKKAIKVDLIYVGTAVPRDEKLFRTLQLSFLQLASFIPDESVVLFSIDAALEAKDLCGTYYRYLIDSEKSNRIIIEQTGLLVGELDVFCQDNGL